MTDGIVICWYNSILLQDSEKPYASIRFGSKHTTSHFAPSFWFNKYIMICPASNYISFPYITALCVVLVSVLNVVFLRSLQTIAAAICPESASHFLLRHCSSCYHHVGIECWFCRPILKSLLMFFTVVILIPYQSKYFLYLSWLIEQRYLALLRLVYAPVKV